ncbi:MAG TPA: zinc-ribbon domain-containing protein, partial [Pyrinomonadaceae bacterium]|nr:zinc-ribbon domain-containing protein [Pyrinomonadaceae bacterium]
MYCPRCAAQNLDDAKYCRACGTNLETVALALAGKRQLADAPADRDASRTWIEERREGISKIVRGT